MERAQALRTLQAAAIWSSVVAALALLWLLRGAVLVAFGSVLAALLLAMLAEQIRRWTRLPRGLALLAATASIVAVGCAAMWFFGTEAAGQLADVLDRVKAGESQIDEQLRSRHLAAIGQEVASTGTSYIGAGLGVVASAALGAVEGAVIILISAIYLAAEPQVYRRGLILLFDPRSHDRVKGALDTLGRSLRLWLVGQLILMLAVGLSSYAAVWTIGLPNPLALALIAGVTEIVPYLGPLVGGLAAILVALTLGVWPAIWTAAAYLAIHVIEGYVMMPLLQRRFVTIPPAIMLTGIVAMSVIFGTAGVIFAAPLTVALFTAVKLFYVRQTLKEPVDLPGETAVDPAAG